MIRFVIIIAFLFFAGCTSHKDNTETKSQENRYSEPFLQMKNNVNFDTPKVFDIEALGVNRLVSSGELILIDSAYYNNYLSNYIQLDEGHDKLYFYSIKEDKSLSASIIRVIKFNTTIYKQYLVTFTNDGEIRDVYEVSQYEAYPGGELSMRSEYINDSIIIQTFIESYVFYDSNHGNELEKTDSIIKSLQIIDGRIKLVRSDTIKSIK